MLNQFRFLGGHFPLDVVTIQITGSDSFDFLQKQSTYDISSILEKSFQLISFLDPQGRIETWGWLLKDENDFLFLVPTNLKDNSLKRLNKFLVSEDVEFRFLDKNTWHVLLGANVEAPYNSFFGTFFDEKAYLVRSEAVIDREEVDPESLELWRGLTGWPNLDGSLAVGELVNQHQLFELAVSMKKGCYPGQETVSKIYNNRGAAFAPVLIEVDQAVSSGEIFYNQKKVGVVLNSFEWENKIFLESKVLRDFRVEKSKFTFEKEGKTHIGTIRYFPLIKGDKQSKSSELTWMASEFFKKDNFESAEECLRLAIQIDPSYQDAYESLGVMLGRLDRFAEAIDIMKELLVVHPNSVLAHTNLSLFLMKMGKIEEAEEHKSQATIKSFKQFGEEAKIKKEIQQKKQAQEEEWLRREKMFYQVLDIDSEDTLANYGIGSIMVERGEWNRAIEYLEKVISVDHKYSVAYLALGKALKAIGRKEDARKVWSEGIKVAATKGDLMPANQMQSEIEGLY